MGLGPVAELVDVAAFAREHERGLAMATYSRRAIMFDGRESAFVTVTKGAVGYRFHPGSIVRITAAIAHLPNWRLLATGYRGRLDRFDVFLDAITKLEIYQIS